MVIRLHTLGTGLAALLNEVHSLSVSLASPHALNSLAVPFVIVALPNRPQTDSKRTVHNEEHGNVLNGQTTEQHFSTFLLGSLCSLILARLSNLRN